MKVYVMTLKGSKKIESEISENSLYIFRSKKAARESVACAGGGDFYDVRIAELTVGRKV